MHGQSFGNQIEHAGTRLSNEIQSCLKSLTTIVIGEKQPNVIPMNVVMITVENEMSAMMAFLKYNRGGIHRDLSNQRAMWG